MLNIARRRRAGRAAATPATNAARRLAGETGLSTPLYDHLCLADTRSRDYDPRHATILRPRYEYGNPPEVDCLGARVHRGSYATAAAYPRNPGRQSPDQGFLS